MATAKRGRAGVGLGSGLPRSLRPSPWGSLCPVAGSLLGGRRMLGVAGEGAAVPGLVELLHCPLRGLPPQGRLLSALPGAGALHPLDADF